VKALRKDVLGLPEAEVAVLAVVSDMDLGGASLLKLRVLVRGSERCCFRPRRPCFQSLDLNLPGWTCGQICLRRMA
jgi:hypothetical protein